MNNNEYMSKLNFIARVLVSNNFSDKSNLFYEQMISYKLKLICL